MHHQQPHSDQIADHFNKTLTLAHQPQHEPVKEVEDINEEHEEEEEDDDDDGDDGDDFEFFVCGGNPNSPVSAEDVFLNGQIRPIFPYSNEKYGDTDEATTSYGPPVRKLYVVSSSSPENDDVAEGPYCAWSSEKSPENDVAPAPEMSRKSNSTGFSKLWKVRDLLVRSHSDGKDAFVFLKDEKIEFDKKKKKKKEEMNVVVNVEGEDSNKKKKKKKKEKSAYEELYGKKEKKGGKSYLPYRVGFFTNASGMSRNVHPY